MTPEQMNEITDKFFGVDLSRPRYAPVVDLLAFTRELQAYVLAMAEHLASPPSPEKTATYYQLLRRTHALAQTIQPKK